MRHDFLLLSFATLILAADVFIYPPPANSIPDDSDQLPRFKVGSTVTLRWSSKLSTISIGLRTKGDKILLLGGAAQGNILEEQTNRNTTSWKVQSIGTTATDGTYYLAGISPNQASFFTSNYFIIEPADSITTTSSSTSSTSSTSLTSSLSTSLSTSSSTQLTVSQTADPATAVTSTSKLPTPSVVPKSGLGTGAKVAIGVSIPLVFIALLAAGFFFYRRGVKKGQMAAAEKSEAGLHPQLGNQNYQVPAQLGGYYDPKKAYMPPAEMSGGEENTRHELPAEQAQRHQLS